MEAIELMNAIQDRMVHAAALAGILSMAVTDIAPSSDLSGACEVLCDYIEKTADIIEDLILKMGNGNEQQGIS